MASKNFTFNNAPAIQMKRSHITGLSYGVNTSSSVGRLCPFYVEEILPGDTFKVKSELVVRLASEFVKPIYGNLFVDVFYFFVPWRLVYDDFSAVFGENKDSYWKPSTETFLPMIPAGSPISSKSVSDYLEIPLGVTPVPINVLYHRANALIWNEWFRDENYQEPCFIHRGAYSSTDESPNENPWSPDNYVGLCPTISKFRDYFTSVLPQPQKGDPIELTVGDPAVPVYAGASTHIPFDPTFNSLKGLSLRKVNSNDPSFGNDYNTLGLFTGNNTTRGIVSYTPADSQSAEGYQLTPDNLYANLSNVKFATVNELRTAFQLQKILERDALGTRYVEHILNTFGVTNPDSRLQRPELLNASRFNLNIQQVSSTSGATEGNLAKLGAYSLSNGSASFSKAFSEYGCVIGLFAVRQYHTYQQGLPKRYTRRRRFDFYNPAMAYLGMMPVMTTEIYMESDPDDIFGYQRAWSEYRHHQNVVSGQMRSDAVDSLDVWQIADYYDSQPYAGDEFVRETATNLDNVITVNSSAQDQFILDVWHDVDAIRVMPANPMPGLIDHY